MNKEILRKCKQLIQKEAVLCAAVLLAVVSACAVGVDAEYIRYIDYRTLAILFCLMCVMAGLQKLDVFRWIAERLLGLVRGVGAIAAILVFLCYFFGMAITNDVALITFVPFTFVVLRMMPEEQRNRLCIPVVVLQTIAANLGSMLTPIGNPQNLYLYGKAGISPGSFIWLMLPYTAAAGVLLLGCCVWLGRGGSAGEGSAGEGSAGEGFAGEGSVGEGFAGEDSAGEGSVVRKEEIPGGDEAAGSRVTGGKAKALRIAVYLILFLVCLLTVARILPYPIMLAIVAAVVFLMDRRVFAGVDYSLLLTFTGFFVFIGNMGRIPAFCDFLEKILTGREVLTAIVSSQVISNMPAALLLSGFTEDYEALIVGTNLGGLGTLIASMASLISYKFIAADYPGRKGAYIGMFTLVCMVFLAAELAVWALLM